MTLFFLVVGLEAKRELDLGELRERTAPGDPGRRRARRHGDRRGASTSRSTPAATAPRAGASRSRPTPRWRSARSRSSRAGARSACACSCSRSSSSTTSSRCSSSRSATPRSVSVTALAVAVGAVRRARRAALGRARGAGRPRCSSGVGIWLAMFESGVDAGDRRAWPSAWSRAPTRRRAATSSAAPSSTRSFREQPTPELAYSARASLDLGDLAERAPAVPPAPVDEPGDRPALRARQRRHPPRRRPAVGDAVTSPVTLGIVAAYVVGKPLGHHGRGVAGDAPDARRRAADDHLARRSPAAAASAGVGFTVSLLVADARLRRARCSTRRRSACSRPPSSRRRSRGSPSRSCARLPAETRARQLGATAETLVDLADDVDPERDHIRGRRRRAGHAASSTATSSARTAATPRRSSRKLLDHLGDELRYVFRHLPLTDVHPNAQLAAEAAEAAGAQGAFWEMHDRLLAAPGRARAVATSTATRRSSASTSTASPRTCAAGGTPPRVAEDVQSADASGVSGTPTFFVNGRRHQGVYDVDTLTRAVKAAARARSERAPTGSVHGGSAACHAGPRRGGWSRGPAPRPGEDSHGEAS